MKGENEVANRSTQIDTNKRFQETELDFKANKATEIDAKANKETKIDGNIERKINTTQMLGRTLKTEKDTYTIKEFLNSSGEADVYICTGTANKTKYALKLYDSRMKFDPEKRKKFIDFLYENKDKHIEPLLDYGTYENRVFDIYPYYKNGDLTKQEISLEFIQKVIIPNVNKGLNYIHKNHIIHRDIKPQNIFIADEKNRVVIGDFGILSVVDSENSRIITSTASKTSGFAAPEVYQKVPGYKSDYYAMGIMLLSLLRKKDVFKGLQEEQIMYKTIWGEIPLLNKEKFAETIIKPSLEDRIEGLICGLTMQTPQERWGYEEVIKWCKGIITSPKMMKREKDQTEFTTPFKFNNISCTNPKTLAKAITKDWKKSKDCLYRGIFTNYLSKENPELSNELYDIIEDTENYKVGKEKDDKKDIGLFKAIYKIDPNLECICWKGKTYKNLKDFVNEIIQDTSIGNILANDGLSECLENILKEEESKKELIDRIKQIEKFAKTSPEEAAYRLYYISIDKKDSKIYIDDRNFDSIDDMISKLEPKKGTEKYINKIFKSPSFKALLWADGRQKMNELNEIAEKEEKNKGEKDIGIFIKQLMILEAITEKQKEKLRQIALEYGEYAHVYWLTKHLDEYRFYGQKATKLKTKLESAVVNTKQEISEAGEILVKAETYYFEFQRNLLNNPFDLKMGNIEEKELKDAIVPISLNSMFLAEYKGIKVPINYLKKIESAENVKKAIIPLRSLEQKATVKSKTKQKEYASNKLDIQKVSNKKSFKKVFTGLLKIIITIAIAILAFMYITPETIYKTTIVTVDKMATERKEKGKTYSLDMMKIMQGYKDKSKEELAKLNINIEDNQTLITMITEEAAKPDIKRYMQDEQIIKICVQFPIIVNIISICTKISMLYAVLLVIYQLLELKEVKDITPITKGLKKIETENEKLISKTKQIVDEIYKKIGTNQNVSISLDEVTKQSEIVNKVRKLNGNINVLKGGGTTFQSFIYCIMYLPMIVATIAAFIPLLNTAFMWLTTWSIKDWSINVINVAKIISLVVFGIIELVVSYMHANGIDNGRGTIYGLRDWLYQIIVLPILSLIIYIIILTIAILIYHLIMLIIKLVKFIIQLIISIFKFIIGLIGVIIVLCIFGAVGG